MLRPLAPAEANLATCAPREPPATMRSQGSQRAAPEPSTRTVPPQELTDAAHKAARLTDTDAHIQTASRSYTCPRWYQSRVWDPDD